MNNLKTDTFDRLFQAKSVVFVGGKDVFIPIKEIKRRGFKGRISVVNPNRDKILGYKCLKDVSDLPYSPDAAFLAVPADKCIGIIKQLKKKGCGGIVCYSAGFKETGSKGEKLENDLILAAGDMPIIGPNCYGIINYVENLALWPFAHGGFSPGWGAAIITQSGMLSSDITMTQRTIPMSYMVSLGNQASVGMEHLISYFSSKREVKAIGIHIEGLKNIKSFYSAALFALEAKKPIVAFKTGTSKIGKNLTKSHTGSLSGDEEVFSALCDKLGIIQVTNAVQFLETLKFMSISRPVKNNRVLGFTCSGGGATMLADHGEKIGLNYPKFNSTAKNELKKLLPKIATVSNPLDYTTPIWGISDKTYPVFLKSLTSLKIGSTIINQDYPSAGLNESESSYWNDSLSFVNAAKKANVPYAVCSTFPENIGAEVREKLIALGSVPMQGINETLNAIKSSYLYYKNRLNRKKNKSLADPLLATKAKSLNEYEGKFLLKQYGVQIPRNSKFTDSNKSLLIKLSFPLALKYAHSKILHKTEKGVVHTDIQNQNELEYFVSIMENKIKRLKKDEQDGFIFAEKMLRKPIAELFLSFRNDADFGKILVIGVGGIFTELFSDAKTILFPISRYTLLEQLKSLKGYKLLTGFRGRKKVNINKLLCDLLHLSNFFLEESNNCVSLEINPLFVYENETVVTDCVMQKKLS